MLLSELLKNYKSFVSENITKVYKNDEDIVEEILVVGEFALQYFVSGVEYNGSFHNIDIVKKVDNGFIYILWTTDLAVFNDYCKIDCSDPNLTVEDLLLWIQAQDMDWSSNRKANVLALNGRKVEKMTMVSRTKKASKI